MAKRKRLSVPDPAAIAVTAAPETKSMFPSPGRSAPIAEVAAQASVVAALGEMSDTLHRARQEGRMVLDVPLDAIDSAYLTRDRTRVGEDEMASLMASLRARGQQTPIEVAPLPGGRYGLISGWRRLTALRRLHDETGEARFASAGVLLRSPAEASQAYVAMVEENEIRADLSYWERAKIVVKSVDQGVFGSHEAALSGLFGTAPRARRSKIRSFVGIVVALDGALRFPEALSERVGLVLARALDQDTGLQARVRDALAEAEPGSAEAERALLQDLTSGRRKARPDGAAARAGKPRVAHGRQVIDSDLAMITHPDGRVTLEGRKVDAALRQDLLDWLAARQGRG